MTAKTMKVRRKLDDMTANIKIEDFDPEQHEALDGEPAPEPDRVIVPVDDIEEPEDGGDEEPTEPEDIENK